MCELDSCWQFDDSGEMSLNMFVYLCYVKQNNGLIKNYDCFQSNTFIWTLEKIVNIFHFPESWLGYCKPIPRNDRYFIVPSNFYRSYLNLILLCAIFINEVDSEIGSIVCRDTYYKSPKLMFL